MSQREVEAHGGMFEPYLVGIAEHNSAMAMATHWMKIMAIIQPQTIPAVPAYPIPKQAMCQLSS
jgi:hypothetical protein